MKKIVSILIVCLLAVFGFAACNNTIPSQKTLVAVWNTNDHNYEKFTYSASHPSFGEGDTATLVVEYARYLQYDFTIGDKSFTSTSGDVMKTTFSLNGETVIDEQILFGASNANQRFTPSYSYRKTVKDGVETVQTLSYASDKCVIAINGEVKTELSLKSPYYDNAQLYALARGCGSSLSLTANVPYAADLTTASIILTASTVTADITSAFGTVNCFRTSINRNETLTGAPIYVYVASGSVSASGLAIQNAIVKIEEGDTVYILSGIETAKIDYNN